MQLNFLKGDGPAAAKDFNLGPSADLVNALPLCHQSFNLGLPGYSLHVFKFFSQISIHKVNRMEHAFHNL